MTYIAQAHRPFPAPMEGDLDGAFFERSVGDGAIFFYLIIRPKRYLRVRDQELIDQGHFSLEDLHPEVLRLGRIPSSDTLWLYELESFKVDCEHHGDQETFNDNAKDYRSEVFDNLSTLLDHCQNKFGISASDFKKREATHYPTF
jgi:hypothetical protein